MIGYDDPGFRGADPLGSAMGLLGYAMEMAGERQACLRDDIVTTLVKAEIDGEHLSIDEFGFFVLMLAVAGNETTRNAISHGMLALLDNPDQWELLKAQRPRTAVDEIVRCGTPGPPRDRPGPQRHRRPHAGDHPHSGGGRFNSL